MIEIVIKNSYTFIRGELYEGVHEDIGFKCSYFVKGAYYTKPYKEGHWDGRKKLYNRKTQAFPTGLISRVTKILKAYKIQYTVIDSRVKPEQSFSFDWMFPHKMRDYQIKIAKDAIAQQRGIIEAATASGKTVISMRMICSLGVKTLFVVNTLEAVEDAIRAAEQCFGADIFNSDYFGRWQGKSKKIGDFFTICTMAGAVSKFKKDDEFQKANFQCLFIDECHHSASRTWSEFSLSIDAYYEYGLTGTNFRNDGAGILLTAITGKTIGKISSAYLQKQGFLAKSEVFFIKVEHPQRLDIALPYPEAYKYGIVENEYRNALILFLVKKHLGTSILIVIEKIAHGENLLKEIKKIDSNAVFIQSKSKERKKLKDSFESGKIRTVIASKLYNESVDVPIIEIVINASGGKSGIGVLQKIGRALRLHPGKEKAIIYDFLDMFNYKLEEHSRERIRYVKKEKHQMDIIDLEIPFEDKLDSSF